MTRILTLLLSLAILVAVAGVWLLAPGEIQEPLATANPPGISQRSVREVMIGRAECLSPDKAKVWVKARVGEEASVPAAVLVDLESGASLYQVDETEVIGWISKTEVLFARGKNTDSNLKKMLRRMGASLRRRYETRLLALDVVEGTWRDVGTIGSTREMSFFTLSPNGKWGIGTWGPLNCHEIDLQQGIISDRVGEDYVWSPKFLDDETYAFVGETTIQTRRVGRPGSERVSQPMLEEIRDALIEKGTPSLMIVGRAGGRFLALDQYPSREEDRLLVLDESTSLVTELARLKPGSHIPRFNSDGSALVYQGHLFQEDMDTVYYQKVEMGSVPQVLVEGKQGNVNQSTPVFLDDDTVLYVHWGTELLSRTIGGQDPRLYWPVSIVTPPTQR